MFLISVPAQLGNHPLRHAVPMRRPAARDPESLL